MTDQQIPDAEPEEKKRRLRGILVLFVLPLIACVVLFASQAGLIASQTDSVDRRVRPQQTADYGEWEQAVVGRLNPQLSTLIAIENAPPQEQTEVVRQILSTAVARGFTDTPTPTRTSSPTATASGTPSPSATATATATDDPFATNVSSANSPVPLDPTSAALATQIAATITQQANEPPIALFSADPPSGTAPLTVRFANRSIGDITTNTWSFGDGASTSTNRDPLPITYPNPGEYVVSLVVEGPQGSDFTEQTIVVSPDYGDNTDLQLTTSLAQNLIAPGETVIATFTIANTSPNPAADVALFATIPAGLEVVAASEGCTFGNTGLTCAAGTLNAGDEVSFTVQYEGIDLGEWIVGVEVTSLTEDVLPENNTGAFTITVSDEPPPATPLGTAVAGNPLLPTPAADEGADLSLSLSASPGSIEVDETSTFRLTVSNNSAEDATGVVVNWQLPNGLAYASGSAGCSQSGATVTCDVGTLAAGTSTTLEITLRGTQNGTQTVTATVQTDSADPNTVNNTASVGIQVSGSLPPTATPVPLTPTTEPAADLRLSKTALTPNVTVGDTVRYQLTVTNLGPNTAQGVRVVDSLPGGLSFQGASGGCGNNGGQVVCDLGTLDAGASTTVTIETRSTSAGTLTNSAGVSASTNDPATGNNNASAVTVVSSPPPTDADLRVATNIVVGSLELGDTARVNVDITNDGPVNATGITVTSTLGTGISALNPSAGCTVNGSTVTCVYGSLASGGTTRATFDIQGGATGTWTVASSVSGAQSDPNTGNNNASDSVVVFLPTQADVSVVKSASPTVLAVGETTTFTLSVNNNGPATANNVQVTDTLPAGLTPGTLPPACSAAANVITCNLGTLTSENSQSISYNATAAVVGAWTNQAEVTATEPDPNLANNIDSATVTLTTATTVNLAMSASVTNAAPQVGDLITYEINVVNNGPANITTLQLEDVLPPDLTYQTSTPAGLYDPGTGVWTINSPLLNAGNSVQLLLTARVDGDNGGAPITKTTSVLSITEVNTGDSSASVSIVVAPPSEADLSIAIASTQPLPFEAAAFSYTVTVTNNGPDDAMGVSADLTLPAEITLNTAPSPSQGSYAAGLWTVGNLLDGQTATIVLDVQSVLGTAATKINNPVSVSAVDPADPTPGNNNAAVEVTIRPFGDLNIDKGAVGGRDAQVGDTKTFVITVDNPGPDNVTDVVVSDVLDPALSYVGSTATQGTYDPGTSLWTVGALNVGDTAELQIDILVTAPGESSRVDNVAVIDSLLPGDPETNDNDDDRFLIIGPAADVAVDSFTISNTGPDNGDTVTLTAVVLNNGPDPATNIQATLALPTGLAFVSDTTTQGNYAQGSGLWNVGNLAVGATATLEIQATVTGAAGDVINLDFDIDTSQPFDPFPGNNDGDITIVVSGDADLGITLMVDDENPSIGDEVAFTVNADNLGPAPASNVQVDVVLPAALALDSSMFSSGTYDEPSGQWTIPNIPSGGSHTLTLIGTVLNDNGGNPAETTATVTAADQNDPDAANNDDTASFTVFTGADLDVMQTVTDNAPFEGGETIFQIRVSNLGPENATGVQISNPIPADLTLLEATTTVGTYDAGTGVWDVGAIVDGGFELLTLRVEVGMGIAGSTITSTADVVAADQADVFTTNNTDSASINVLAPLFADLVVQVTALTANPMEGDTVTFEIVLTNNGPETATNPSVSIPLPPDLTLQTPVSAPAGTFWVGDRWDVPTLAAGNSQTLQLSFVVNGGTVGQTIPLSAEITGADQLEGNPGDEIDSDAITVVP